LAENLKDNLIAPAILSRLNTNFCQFGTALIKNSVKIKYRTKMSGSINIIHSEYLAHD